MQKIFRCILPIVSLAVLLWGCPPNGGLQPFDCSQTIEDLSGLVEVDDPIAGRYIVVLKPAALGPAGADRQVAIESLPTRASRERS